MNRAEAKRILLPYRPGTDDARDPEIAEALALAGRDLELQGWLAQHVAFHESMRTKLRGMPVPARLMDAILAERKTVRPVFWQRPPVWLAAAAVLVLLLGFATLWLQPQPPDRFADFRSRMVRSALRQYSMDIVSDDMQQVRQFMADRAAPADYRLPAGLARLSLTGGGALKWRNQPVAMVCFDRGDNQMLFLFVLERAAVKDAPPSEPQATQVNKLMTVSWSDGDRTYVLAGPAEENFVKKYVL
jgi:hypothetical protein